MTSIWGDDALFGRLAADIGESNYAVPFDFFTVSLQQTNAAGQTIQNMLMNTLGSKTNRGVMTLMIKDANLLKEKVRLFTRSHVLARIMTDGRFIVMDTQRRPRFPHEDGESRIWKLSERRAGPDQKGEVSIRSIKVNCMDRRY